AGAAGPRDMVEGSGDGSAVSVERVVGRLEGGPADHVVFEIRALTVDRVVDREEEVGVQPLVERVLDLGGVELGAGHRVVPAERHRTAIALQDPVSHRVRPAVSAVASVDVDDLEASGTDLLQVERRRNVEARTAGPGKLR